jgi:hypothetical protein
MRVGLPTVYYTGSIHNNLQGFGLLKMRQISKYKQPSFATVLQRALLYTYMTTCFG